MTRFSRGREAVRDWDYGYSLVTHTVTHLGCLDIPTNHLWLEMRPL